MKPRRYTPPESAVQAHCLQYLALRGVFCWRQNQGAAVHAPAGGKRRYVRFTSVAGVSDVLGILPGGRFLAVECKRQGGRVRPAQRDFLAAVNAAGGLGIVVHSLDELRAAVDPLLGDS